MDENIQIASYSIILLYNMINAMKARTHDDTQTEQMYYQIVSHEITMRNLYLANINKTFLDDTVFQEFILKCIGEPLSSEKERQLLIEARKARQEPLVYRYNPKDEKEPPIFKGFKNCSGNKISNPKNLKLTDFELVDDNVELTTESHPEVTSNND